MTTVGTVNIKQGGPGQDPKPVHDDDIADGMGATIVRSLPSWQEGNGRGGPQPSNENIPATVIWVKREKTGLVSRLGVRDERDGAVTSWYRGQPIRGRRNKTDGRHAAAQESVLAQASRFRSRHWPLHVLVLGVRVPG